MCPSVNSVNLGTEIGSKGFFRRYRQRARRRQRQKLGFKIHSRVFTLIDSNRVPWPSTEPEGFSPKALGQIVNRKATNAFEMYYGESVHT